MTTTKPLPKFETLQDAMRSTVGAKNNSGLTVDEWAHILGHAVSTMYAKGRAVPFTIEDLVTITALGHLEPLKHLAAVGRAVVFELPKEMPQNARVFAQVTESTKSFGELLQSISEAQSPDSDGGVAITPKEALVSKGRALDLAAKVAAFIATMDEIIDGEKRTDQPQPGLSSSGLRVV